MKKTAFLLIALAPFAVLSLGCNTGPGEASVEEAKESMEATMEMDTMAETEDVDAGGGAAADGAGTEGAADTATP